MSEVRIQQQWFMILQSNNQNDSTPSNNIEIPWAPRSILRLCTTSNRSAVQKKREAEVELLCRKPYLFKHLCKDNV